MKMYFFFVNDPLVMFIDQCSLANVSVVILTDKLSGHYIHGESVHPHADADMKEFFTYLSREESNAVMHRGLLPESTIQTFDVYITPAFRQAYMEKLTIPAQQAEANARIETQQRAATEQQQGYNFKFRKFSCTWNTF